jgi:hypothetical protein
VGGKKVVCSTTLVKCYYATSSFDFLMSKEVHNIFALVIKFLGVDWQPKHIII